MSVSIHVPIVFAQIHAFLAALHGSSKTQNIEDALADAQSGEPVACPTPEQMPAVWQYRRLSHCVSVVRLLPRAASVDTRRQVDSR